MGEKGPWILPTLNLIEARLARIKTSAEGTITPYFVVCLVLVARVGVRVKNDLVCKGSFFRKATGKYSSNLLIPRVHNISVGRRRRGFRQRQVVAATSTVAKGKSRTSYSGDARRRSLLVATGEGATATRCPRGSKVWNVCEGRACVLVAFGCWARTPRQRVVADDTGRRKKAGSIRACTPPHVVGRGGWKTQRLLLGRQTKSLDLKTGVCRKSFPWINYWVIGRWVIPVLASPSPQTTRVCAVCFTFVVP